MLICSAALSSTMRSRLRRGLAYSLICDSAAATLSVVVGLLTKENAPRASACCRSSSSVMIWTGMCRVSGLCLSWLNTVQPSMSGRNTSSETAVGWNCLARSSASVPRLATRTLKPLSRARSIRIRLLKRLEDQLLFFDRDADAGVGHLEGNDGGRMIQDRVLGAPSAQRRRHRQPDAAFGGELEGIRQQVLQHLLQALGVGHHAAGEVLVDADVERQLAVFGFVLERPADRFQHARGQDFLGVDRPRSGFDLRQVEDVADQIE